MRRSSVPYLPCLVPGIVFITAGCTLDATVVPAASPMVDGLTIAGTGTVIGFHSLASPARQPTLLSDVSNRLRVRVLSGQWGYSQ